MTVARRPGPRVLLSEGVARVHFLLLAKGKVGVCLQSLGQRVSLSPAPSPHVSGTRGRCFSARASLEVGPLSLSAATPGVPWAAAPHVEPLAEAPTVGLLTPSFLVRLCAGLSSQNFPSPLVVGSCAASVWTAAPLIWGLWFAAAPVLMPRLSQFHLKSLCGLKRPCSSVSTVFGTCVPGSLCPCPGLGCYLETKMWVPGVPIAAVGLLFPGPVAELGNGCLHMYVRARTEPGGGALPALPTLPHSIPSHLY